MTEGTPKEWRGPLNVCGAEGPRGLRCRRRYQHTGKHGAFDMSVQARAEWGGGP